MRIDAESCLGCGECVPYCPMGVIKLENGIAVIDEEECVECGICENTVNCPVKAIYQNKLEWPRNLRSQFSNPLVTHTGTGITGRGTEEMKTNDVTNRYTEGMFGLGIEMGRPGIGTRFKDVQKVAMAMAELGIEFEPANPVTQLMTDPKSGKFREDILNEKVLSCIIEFAAPLEKLPVALEKLKEVAKEIDTVFSVSLISRVDKEGDIPVVKIARQHGFNPSIRTKTNVGLGKIPAKEGDI